MSDRIKHAGIVESVSDECVKVRIVQSSACSACKAASFCNAAESKEKIVDVYGYSGDELSEGQQVVVVASQRTGRRAVIIGFVLPFVVMVAALVVTWLMTRQEPLAGLVGLLSLVPYYLAVYLLRDKLREQFSFWIE